MIKHGQSPFSFYSCHGINYGTNDCVIMIPLFPLENLALSNGSSNGKLYLVMFFYWYDPLNSDWFVSESSRHALGPLCHFSMKWRWVSTRQWVQKPQLQPQLSHLLAESLTFPLSLSGGSLCSVRAYPAVSYMISYDQQKCPRCQTCRENLSPKWLGNVKQL